MTVDEPPVPSCYGDTGAQRRALDIPVPHWHIAGDLPIARHCVYAGMQRDDIEAVIRVGGVGEEQAHAPLVSRVNRLLKSVGAMWRVAYRKPRLGVNSGLDSPR